MPSYIVIYKGLTEEGHIKYQSNIEKHRNYITTHRVDDSYSALYAAHEDTFISIAEGKDQGSLSETIYKMDKKEKVLLDNFLFVRNNGLNNRSFKILLIAGNLSYMTISSQDLSARYCSALNKVQRLSA